jgi:methionine synthase II (cobalamin-independent)
MPAAHRADHVGSLLRPPEILAARQSSDVTPDELHALEDRHVKRVLDKQKELGFDVFTDGELRRRNFMSDFTDAVSGLDYGDAVARKWQSGSSGSGGVSKVAGIVTEKLRQVRPLTGHELPFLKAHSPGPIKMTLPSATQFPAITFKRGVTDSVYESHTALLWDIVEIMRSDLRKLAGEGVSYIQIDAPRYSYFIDPKWRDWIQKEMGMEPGALLDESIRADNACLEAARGPGVTLAMHLCRGNNRSHWYAEGGYDAIAEQLFNDLACERIFAEYDSPRAGNFEPLRFVPEDKSVILGLITTKEPELETEEQLKSRIEEASEHIPLERLGLSPQCGFASTLPGNLVTFDDQKAKLELLGKVAHEVWS